MSKYLDLNGLETLWGHITSKLSTKADKNGSNATGTWGISISGSSASCTGNAATATKATKDGSGNTITSTYATKNEVSNINIGGRNLLKPATVSGYNTVGGNNYNVTINPKAGDTYFFVNTQEALVGGKEYTLSFEVSGLVSGTSYVWYILNNSSLASSAMNYNGKHVITFTLPAANNGITQILIDDGPQAINQSTAITISKLKLEAGNKATDWSPAFEEYVTINTDQTILGKKTYTNGLTVVSNNFSTPLTINRAGADGESTKFYQDDSAFYIDMTNDEIGAMTKFVYRATDMENSDGSGAKGATITMGMREADGKTYLIVDRVFLGDEASLDFHAYSNTRNLNISTFGLFFDYSTATSGWQSGIASVKAPGGTTTDVLGIYGGNEGLLYSYMGGTYTDPAMKMTPDGVFTFKNTVNASVSGGASYLTADSTFDLYKNRFQYFNLYGNAGAAKEVNDTPTTNYWHILRHTHSNYTGYYTDLAIPFNENSIYYKRVQQGTVQNWVKVLDSRNYQDYLPAYNLFNNSNFLPDKFIAQVGVNNYHGSTRYVGDRWINGNITVAHQSDGMKLTSANQYGYIGQKVKLVPGKVYTAIFKVSGQTVNPRVVLYRHNLNQYVNEHAGYVYTFTPSVEDITICLFPGGSNSAGGSCVLEWAALYEGSYDENTAPAYKYKGYITELNDCKYYFERENFQYIYPVGVDTCYFTQDFTKKRLENPTVTGSITTSDNLTIATSGINFWDSMNSSIAGLFGTPTASTYRTYVYGFFDINADY